MLKLGCATVVLLLLVAACLWKAGALPTPSSAPALAIPPACVAVGQPRSDAHHTLQLARCGPQFDVLGQQDQGPTYVIALSPWYATGANASLAYATFPSQPCVKVYVLYPKGESPVLVGLDKC